MQGKSGILYGIGVGPGDPELVTVKAARILGQVDLVAVPVSVKDKESLAKKIAAPYIRPGCPVLEVAFPMTLEQQKLEEAWQDARKKIKQKLDSGQSVAFLTLGDPLLYSTFIYLYQQFAEAGYRIKTVPGISAFGAAASAAGVPLVIGSEKMAIIPGDVLINSNPEDFEAFETVAIFKVSRVYDRLVHFLAAAGRLKDSVLVISCGLPEEQVVTELQSMVGKKIPYFSLIIARKEQKQ